MTGIILAVMVRIMLTVLGVLCVVSVDSSGGKMIKVQNIGYESTQRHLIGD